MQGLPDKFFILDVGISQLTLDRAWESINQMIDHADQGYICVAPVATIMDCQDNDQYKAIVNQASMVTPDGMPVVWLAHRKGYNNVQRTYGPDLMPLVCDRGREKGLRHFFYGGSPEVLEKLTQKLQCDYPGVNIVGQFCPPQCDIGFQEDADVIDQINQAKPDIIWVGLGSPKQDFWMAQHRGTLNAPVMVGVGAAFDFLAGCKPQAPQWMQRSGLEWFYRLCSEPQRLWKRYLIGNTRFLLLILKRLLVNRTIG